MRGLSALLVAGLALPLGLVVTAACDSAGSCAEQGIRQYASEDYKSASKSFELAVAANGDNADHLLWLGRALGRRAERATGFAKLGAFGQARRARESFEKAIVVDPRHPVALRSLLDFYVAAPGIVGGGVAKAEPLAKRIAALNPADGQRAWATIHSGRKEFDRAESALREAVRLDPQEIGHQLSLASFLARQGRLDESDSLFAEALERAPDSPAVWFSRAKALVRAERGLEEARSLLNRYLAAELPTPDSDPHWQARELLEQI